MKLLAPAPVEDAAVSVWCARLQQEYEQAKAQLAAKRESIARLMSEADRIARVEREPLRQASEKVRN